MFKRLLLMLIILFISISALQAQHEYKRTIVGLLADEFVEQTDVPTSYQFEEDTHMFGATIYLEEYLSEDIVENKFDQIVVKYNDVYSLKPDWEYYKGMRAKLIGHKTEADKYVISLMYDSDAQEAYIYMVKNSEVNRL